MQLFTSDTPSPEVPGWWQHEMPDGLAFHCSQRTLTADERDEIIRVTDAYDGGDYEPEDDPDADGYGWERRALAGLEAHG